MLSIKALLHDMTHIFKIWNGDLTVSVNIFHYLTLIGFLRTLYINLLFFVLFFSFEVFYQPMDWKHVDSFEMLCFCSHEYLQFYIVSIAVMIGSFMSDFMINADIRLLMLSQDRILKCLSIFKWQAGRSFKLLWLQMMVYPQRCTVLMYYLLWLGSSFHKLCYPFRLWTAESYSASLLDTENKLSGRGDVFIPGNQIYKSLHVTWILGDCLVSGFHHPCQILGLNSAIILLPLISPIKPIRIKTLVM